MFAKPMRRRVMTQCHCSGHFMNGDKKSVISNPIIFFPQKESELSIIKATGTEGSPAFFHFDFNRRQKTAKTLGVGIFSLANPVIVFKPFPINDPSPKAAPFLMEFKQVFYRVFNPIRIGDGREFKIAYLGCLNFAHNGV